MTSTRRNTHPARFAALAVAVPIIALITISCSSDSPSTRTLVINQQPPELASFTIPSATTDGAASSPDDVPPPAGVLAFDAEITDPGGRSGLLIGYLLTADLPDARTGDLLEERIGTLVFAFDGDELVVSGGTSYPLDEAEMAVDEPQLRAVVGGTGAFLGARGEVITTRNDDGSYTHTFTLVE